jgi:YVTN family beta-propeller protein
MDAIRSGRQKAWATVIAACASLLTSAVALGAPDAGAPDAGTPRSPVDVAFAGPGRLLTANQSSGSISLVDIERRVVLDEVACGAHPTAVTASADGRQALAAASYAGDLVLLAIQDQRLVVEGRIHLGGEPYGVAWDQARGVAYVSLAGESAVAAVDLKTRKTVGRIAVGPWPRFLALAPDGQRLAVGTSGDQQVWVIDTAKREVLFHASTGGINLGQMQISADGQYVYLPWMVYRQNAITPANIRKGWVLGSRIGRLRLDRAERREAITLDPPGMAVSDPHGLAISPDGQWLLCAAGGTHELLMLRASALKFQSYGGPGDHIDRRLLADPELFARVPLGGRPLAIRMDPNGRSVYVVNGLSDAVQVVDVHERRLAETIPLGGPAEASLARRGEAIFYDGRRSLDQWYSCHSCHWEGGPNAVTMDTKNDRTEHTFKTVPPLLNVARTSPWTWHGWQLNLEDAMRTSLVETMQGPEPSQADCQALVAYLDSLPAPPNPQRAAGGGLSPAADRGRALFVGSKANCASCHRGPYFTDGQVHDVGTGKPADAFDGFNTPSLVGVYRRVRLLHDGRARSLDDVLTGPHAPHRVAGEGELTPDERRDLVEYLKTL